MISLVCRTRGAMPSSQEVRSWTRRARFPWRSRKLDVFTDRDADSSSSDSASAATVWYFSFVSATSF